MRYTDLLGLGPGDVAAIIGSGGKTSLLSRLAEENRDRRVLVSTTTMMMRPEPGQVAGVRLLHGGVVDGKITAPPMDELARASMKAELTLLECDGSKGRPFKGWAAHEPVVPDFATVTIGVLPLWALGLPVREAHVHRVEEFCRLTGARLGKPVTRRHLEAVARHPEGLFQKAVGRRVLFFSGDPVEVIAF